MFQQGAWNRDGPLVSVVRPDVRRKVVRAHAPWCFLSGLVWLLSLFIPYRNPAQLCGFLRWTGYPCMFCGLTPSFAALSQGAWAFAVQNAPLALALYAALIAIFFWNGIALIAGVQLGPGSRVRAIPRMFWIIVGTTLVLLNWAYRLYFGLT